jgi:competence ComEA-like helix-hairpin-helix protein
MQKRPSNHYFSFTRKERNGIVLLLLAIFLLTIVPFIYPLVFKEKPIGKQDIQKGLIVLTAKQEDAKTYTGKNFDNNHYRSNSFAEKKIHAEKNEGALFYFDPNTLSPQGWEQLGLRKKTINTIQHFLSSGGKFKIAEDIKKIWGLHEDEIQRLMPYVKIEENNFKAVAEKPVFSSIKFPEKKSFRPLDINLADSSALISLPGIGPKLSGRIINFREKLGGFYAIDQVAETFGLPDSVFQKIKGSLILNETNARKININTATLDELKMHPYIRYSLANLIIQYRIQHGNFSSIEQIKKIMTVNDELYKKLSPYLTVE